MLAYKRPHLKLTNSGLFDHFLTVSKMALTAEFVCIYIKYSDADGSHTFPELSEWEV